MKKLEKELQEAEAVQSQETKAKLVSKSALGLGRLDFVLGTNIKFGLFWHGRLALVLTSHPDL